MEKPILLENEKRLLEVILQKIKEIDPKALFDISCFPSLIMVKIQFNQELRGRIFNKLYHLHSIYGLKFTPTQFIKKDKSIVSFDLKRI